MHFQLAELKYYVILENTAFGHQTCHISSYVLALAENISCAIISKLGPLYFKFLYFDTFII